MDIFEMANQGMKIQDDEKKAAAAEAAALEKEKSYKVDMVAAMKACARQDYDWFNRLGEHQKHFSPYILNMWLSQIFNKDTSRKITQNDKVYFTTLMNVNYTLNTNLFSVPKEMFWLLACTVNDRGIDEFNTIWVRGGKKSASDKISPKVLNYMSQELWSSIDKISDMIDNDLITLDDIKAIQADLDTLEDPKKKKL